jgi:hypothetical protein
MPEHHAVLYLGRVLADTPLDSALLQNETELEFLTLPVLSIAAVRDLIATSFVRPFEKPTKTIVLEVGQIAPEAQQALLKLLEEPPVTTRFILVLPTFDNLLPTLRSRLYQPTDERELVRAVPQLFNDFVQKSYSERIALITDIAKAKDSTDFELLAEGLRTWVATISVQALTVRIHEWLLVLSKRGASKKMLWEDIALSIPVAR